MKRGTSVVLALIATYILIQLIQGRQNAPIPDSLAWFRIAGGVGAVLLTLVMMRERVPR